MSFPTLPKDFVSHTPTIRSSDFSMLGDPFLYFLTRRLGITSAFSRSRALSTGTWFHWFFEHRLAQPDGSLQPVYDALDKSIAALSATCRELGIIGARRDKILNDERQSCAEAQAFYHCARELLVTQDSTLFDLLTLPHYRHLGNELLIRYGDRVAQLDSLLYHTTQNKLWIVDLKTSALSPAKRMEVCPNEPQTIHYLSVTADLLHSGTLQSTFDLPPNASLGGMIHAVVQKPSISFGANDRDYCLDTTLLKSGPRAGLPRNKRVYQGEPKLDNYIARCLEWYNGDGFYEHERTKRLAEPPVGLSYTTASVLDDRRNSEYYTLLNYLRDLSTREPLPHLFPRNSSLISFGRVDTYAPFYVCPPNQWRSIMQKSHLVFSHRDADPTYACHHP